MRIVPELIRGVYYPNTRYLTRGFRVVLDY